MTVEELDELPMSDIANFAKSHRRREPQSDRKSIVKFVCQVVSIELLSSIGLVTRLVFEMLRYRPE